MSIKDLLYDSFRVFPGTEPVTYTPVGGSPISVPYALREEITAPVLTVNQEFENAVPSLIWHIASDVITSIQYKDQITDGDNVVWLVRSWQLQTQSTRWKLFCEKQQG